MWFVTVVQRPDGMAFCSILWMVRFTPLWLWMSLRFASTYRYSDVTCAPWCLKTPATWFVLPVLYEGNLSMTSGSPRKGPVKRETCPCHDVIMQQASGYDVETKFHFDTCTLMIQWAKWRKTNYTLRPEQHFGYSTDNVTNIFSNETFCFLIQISYIAVELITIQGWGLQKLRSLISP